MKVLQINAVYEKFSTGRSTKELHEAMQSKGIESFVACPDLASLPENGYKIGNKLDWKLHALLSRITGKQGYFSRFATKGLLDYISEVKPDVIHLGNLHSNYINLPMLLKYIAEKDIATVLTLHDSWFYTGKCMYYIEFNCDRWEAHCGNCPALKAGNPSLFLDKTTEMLADKKKLFSAIRRLAVVGVSQWVTDDASRSILKDSSIVQCIYNWIDLERFHPRDCKELKKSMGIENKFVILGIAMIWNKLKGIGIFHELADILPDDCQIVLVGDDSAVELKHAKIKYLGTVKDVDVLSKLYAMADVFVNPTIQETFGKTTAEAMACGTPVVAYNGTATPELVGSDGSCGFLIDENDARLYCDKILQIKMKSKSTFSKATRSRAERLFSKDKNIQMYFEIYERLLKNERSVRK
ncbi:hypothetical protein EB22_01366 [Enterococcus faecium]|uniref:glycosyltransferase n=1 Tax=Enterococcus TaxID=1350 RepID=UPI000DEACE02|nr:glycosyltransferase [Enterococcus faecium]RBS48118.1 hypothetical protein EB22_01366 [Enterococcus faecium]